jgi:BlaI family transcriptional regulator, penicillinase repressor
VCAPRQLLREALPSSVARSLAARAVRQIVDRFCRGSLEELVSGMVDAKVLSRGDMDRLEKFVRNRRPGGK